MIRRLAAFSVVLVLAVACTSSSTPGSDTERSSPPVPSRDPEPSAAPSGAGSAAAALDRLCDTPTPPQSEGGTRHDPVPPVVTAIEAVVEQVRGLTFKHPVPVQALTDAQINDRLKEILASSVSADQLHRRGLAWQTIGVIPHGTDLGEAVSSYFEGQVIGFYVPETGELVFVGSDQPSAVENITLAHELTHALDDQHFDLTRTDKYGINCRDELQMAALGAIEGSAQFYSISIAAELARRGELGEIGDIGSAGASTPGVPPFLMSLEQWPYNAGLIFISRRRSDGGEQAVNEVLRRLPVSTEQVIHPERYPNDIPQPLDVPDLLGSGWSDLDVSEIGEAWFSIMLDLRLDGSRAADAAAGWDGGIYRAWSNGDRVAVMMVTVWDTRADATEFASAMRSWLGDAAAFVDVADATHVSVGFASDADSLAALQAAAG